MCQKPLQLAAGPVCREAELLGVSSGNITTSSSTPRRKLLHPCSTEELGAVFKWMRGLWHIFGGTADTFSSAAHFMKAQPLQVLPHCEGF